MLGCEVCQKEKSVSKVPAGLLELLTLPKNKWANVIMDFIMGLPVSDERHDGIIIVTDKATKVIQLVPLKQTIPTSRLPMSTGPSLGSFMVSHGP